MVSSNTQVGCGVKTMLTWYKRVQSNRAEKRLNEGREEDIHSWTVKNEFSASERQFCQRVSVKEKIVSWRDDCKHEDRRAKHLAEGDLRLSHHYGRE